MNRGVSYLQNYIFFLFVNSFALRFKFSSTLMRLTGAIFLKKVMVWTLPIAFSLPTVVIAQTASDSPVRCSTEEDLGEPFAPVEFKVVGSGRLYFHSAPFPECKTAVFIIPNDYGYTQAVYEDWAAITYFSQSAGDVLSGWVKAERLEITDPRVARGEMGAPPKAAFAP